MATKLTLIKCRQIDYLSTLRPAHIHNGMDEEAMGAMIAKIREVAKTMPLPRLSAIAVDSMPEDFVARSKR